MPPASEIDTTISTFETRNMGAPIMGYVIPIILVNSVGMGFSTRALYVTREWV
jgi:hypothetical protein